MLAPLSHTYWTTMRCPSGSPVATPALVQALLEPSCRNSTYCLGLTRTLTTKLGQRWALAAMHLMCMASAWARDAHPGGGLAPAPCQADLERSHSTGVPVVLAWGRRPALQCKHETCEPKMQWLDQRLAVQQSAAARSGANTSTWGCVCLIQVNVDQPQTVLCRPPHE